MVVGRGRRLVAARSVTSEEEKFRVSCRIVNDRRAIEIGESHPLVKQLSKGLEKKGFRWRRLGLISLQMLRSWWNTSWMQPFSLFGPGEAGMAHKPNERVEIEKYQKSIQVLMDPDRIGGG